MAEITDNAPDLTTTPTAPEVNNTEVNNTPKVAAYDDPEDIFVKQILVNYAKPAIAEGMVNKDKFVKIYGDSFLEKAGNDKVKAKEMIDTQYEMISSEYQKMAEKENKLQMLSSVAFLASGISDLDIVDIKDYELKVDEVAPTISGRALLIDRWTDPVRSAEEAQLDNKKVIDYKGNLIDYKEDAYDELVNNDLYRNADGKKIIGFTYTQAGDEYDRNSDAAIKAVYEGQTVEGELVKRWDTGNTIFKSNGLNNAWYKVAAGSVVDFAVDTVDTFAALAQYTMLGLSLGTIEKTEFYKDFRDIRTTYLGAWTTSKSTEDKESLFTFNNMLSLGINIAGQLLTGKVVASTLVKVFKVGKGLATKIKSAKELLDGAQKTEFAALNMADKLAAAADVKKYKKSYDILNKSFNSKQNTVKKLTLLSMSAMQSKETADEAHALGFAPHEVAAIYFASLASQMIANSLSDVGFEALGIKTVQPIIKKAVKNSTVGMSSMTHTASEFASKTGKISNAVRTGLESVFGSKALGMQMVREGLEEETEYVFDELVRHTATYMKALGQDPKPPKFKTVMDEGYWDNFKLESLMNMGAGSVAGGAMSLVRQDYKFKPSAEESGLKQSKTTEEVFETIAYYSNRTEEGAIWDRDLMKTFEKMRKTGGFGREDISTAWDDKNKRYKRVNELTEDDKKAGHASQAEIMHRAALAQYMYYKHIYSDTTESFDAVKQHAPELDFVSNSTTLFEETKNLFDLKKELYSKAEGIEFDDKLKELQGIKDKARKDGEGVADYTEYNEKVTELSKASKLSTTDVEKLMKVNTAIENIKNGKAVESIFIKHLLKTKDKEGGSKYKNIDFDLLEKVIYSDNEAQSSFKEDLKIRIAKKKELKALLSNDFDPKQGFTQELYDFIVNNISHLALDEADKAVLKEALDNTGATLDSQKARINEFILKDLEDVGAELIRTATSDEQRIELEEYIKGIKEAHANGNSALINFLSSASVDLIDKTNDTTALKFAYILNRLRTIADTSDSSTFPEIQYEQDDVKFKRGLEENTSFNSQLVETLNTLRNVGGVDTGGVSSLSNDISTASLFSVLGFSAPKELLKELDPEYDVKKTIFTTITTIQDVDENATRNDFLHGFTKTAAGDIQVNEDSLLSQFYSVMEHAQKNSANTAYVYLPNKEVAKTVLEQVAIREEEVMFMIDALAVIAKLDYINKNVLKNDDVESTFLTTYIGKYVPDFKQFKELPFLVYTNLSNSLAQLQTIKESLSTVIEQVENSGDEYYTSIYNGKAFEIANKELRYIEEVVGRLDTNSELFITLSTELNASVPGNGQVLSDDALKALTAKIYNLKKILHEEYKKNPSFLNSILENASAGFGLPNGKLTTDYTKAFKTFARYAMLDVDYVNSDIKSILGTSAELPMITSEQLVWIEEMFIFATNPAYADLLSAVIKKEKPNHAITYTSGMFFSALQGTGKSQAVINILTKLLSNHFDNNNAIPLGISFCSFKDSMRASMLRNVEGYVHPLKNEFKDIQELYDRLVNADPNDIFDDLGVIIFDEIGLVDFSASAISGTTQDESNNFGAGTLPTLNVILAKLDAINAKRTAANKPPIRIIGIGDATQPGFVSGMNSPSRGTLSTKAVGEEMHVFHKRNNFTALTSENTLTINMRSKVIGHANALETLAELLRLSKTAEIKYNTSGATYMGTEINKRGEDLAKMADDSDLIKNLEAKLLADDKFKVAIVRGEFTYNGDSIEGTALKKLMDANPGRFHTYSLADIQGSEADYVLAELPNDYLSINSTAQSPDEEKKNLNRRVEVVKMLFGRAAYFTAVATGGKDLARVINIVDTTMAVMENSMTVEFKERWKGYLFDYMLLSNQAAPANAATVNNVIQPVVPAPSVITTTPPATPISINANISSNKINNSGNEDYPLISVLEFNENIKTYITEILNDSNISDNIKQKFIDNPSKENLDELISRIPKTGQENLALISLLKNVVNSLYAENEDTEDILDLTNADQNILTDLDGGNTQSIDVEDDKALMKSAFTQQGKLAFYSDFTGTGTQTEDERKELFASQAFNSDEIEDLQNEYINRIFNDPKAFNYQLHLVTYVSDDGSKKNNIIALYNEKTRKYTIVGQIFDTKDLPDSKIKDVLQEREIFLKTANKNDVNNEIVNTNGFKTLRTDIGWSLVAGRTVGNLVTDSAINSRLEENILNFGIPKGSLVKQDEIIANLCYVPDVNNKGKFIYKVKDGDVDAYLMFIKTSKNKKYIPLLSRNRNSWVPVIGYDGENYFTDNSVAPAGSSFAAAIGKLKFDVDNHIIESDVTLNINKELGVEDIIKNEFPFTLMQHKLKINFKRSFPLSIEDVKLPYSEAKDLINSKNSSIKMSSPVVIIRGKHAGKAIVLYSFNPKYDLANMSVEELNALYDKIITKKNNMPSPLSDNRDGIGIMLLDVKGRTLIELFEQNKEKVREISPTQFNKHLLNGKAMKQMVDILSYLHYALSTKVTTKVHVAIQVEETAKNVSNDIRSYCDALIARGSINPNLQAIISKIFDPALMGNILVSPIGYTQDIINAIAKVSIATQYDKATVAAEIFAMDEAKFKAAGINSADDLLVLTLVDTAPKTSGNLIKDSKGRVKVVKNKKGVITMVHEAFIKGSDSSAIVPSPTFDMFNFIKVLSEVIGKHEGAEQNIMEALVSFDDILLNTGFPEGIFISPKIIKTKSILAAIDIDQDTIDSAFVTDVKRIKSPQTIINHEALAEKLKAESAEKVKIEQEAKKSIIKNQEKVEDAFNSDLDKAKDRIDFQNLIDEVNISELTAEQKEKVILKIHEKFSELMLTNLPVDFNNIDFHEFFLADDTTAPIILALNNLKSAILTEELRKYLWEGSLPVPSVFNVHQMKLFTALSKVKMLTSLNSQDVNSINKIYDSIRILNEGSVVAELNISVQDEAKVNKTIVDITALSYPIVNDMDPVTLLELVIANKRGLQKDITDIIESVKFDSAAINEWLEKALAENILDEEFSKILETLKENIEKIYYNKGMYAEVLSKINSVTPIIIGEAGEEYVSEDFVKTHEKISDLKIEQEEMSAESKVADFRVQLLKNVTRDVIDTELKVKLIEDTNVILDILSKTEGGIISFLDEEGEAIKGLGDIIYEYPMEESNQNTIFNTMMATIIKCQ